MYKINEKCVLIKVVRHIRTKFLGPIKATSLLSLINAVCQTVSSRPKYVQIRKMSPSEWVLTDFRLRSEQAYLVVSLLMCGLW